MPKLDPLALVVPLLVLLQPSLSDDTDAAVAICQPGDDAGWWQDQKDIMGTAVRVELWHEDRAVACRAIGKVMDEMHRIDQSMSPYVETSILSMLNRDGAVRPVIVGAELYGLIDQSLKYSELTDGAFDITYASVGRYYDYREGAAPDIDTVARTVPAIDFRHLEMNAAQHSIRFRHPGVHVDLGGIAKGYAVDQGIQILTDLGFSQAMVSAGGDSRIVGDRRGEPWVVGIRNPRVDGEMSAVLPLMDVAVSTSGDYERYFEKDGVRFHHIIDPSTGDSAREVRSVTVIGPDTTMTDALSTSVFVMGVQHGLDMINGMQGIDAVIIDQQGIMRFSDDLLEMTQASDD